MFQTLSLSTLLILYAKDDCKYSVILLLKIVIRKSAFPEIHISFPRCNARVGSLRMTTGELKAMLSQWSKRLAKLRKL